jgi:hypothetical protein
MNALPSYEKAGSVKRNRYERSVGYLSRWASTIMNSVQLLPSSDFSPRQVRLRVSCVCGPRLCVTGNRLFEGVDDR